MGSREQAQHAIPNQATREGGTDFKQTSDANLLDPQQGFALNSDTQGHGGSARGAKSWMCGSATPSTRICNEELTETLP